MPGRRVRRVRRVVKRRTVTPYAKGHLFEDVVERYFQLLGYRVEKNARVMGFSGAIHEIDVLISKDDVRGVVEAKNYDKPTSKEPVMKVSNVAKDIGATEVYVVSASGFTPDAVKVAEVLGVELLNLDDMVRELRKAVDSTSLPAYYVKPGFKEVTAKEYAFKHVIKKFFKPVEEVDEVELLYYPLYGFEAEYSYVEEVGLLIKRDVKKKIELIILASAVCNCLPVVEENVVTLMEVEPVTQEEAKLLKLLSESEEPLSISDLEDYTGWSRQKVSKIISKLLEKGLVEYEEEESESGRVVRVYYSTIPLIEELKETSEMLIPEDSIKQGKPSGNVKEPRIPSANTVAVINNLYSGLKIHSKKLIYLPIYRAKLLSTEDDTYRYIYFTASTSEPLLLEGFEE